MSYTRKNNSINYDYCIVLTTLNRSNLVKDLGVHFDSRLLFFPPKSLGFGDVETSKLLYCTPVRSTSIIEKPINGNGHIIL